MAGDANDALPQHAALPGVHLVVAVRAAGRDNRDSGGVAVAVITLGADAAARETVKLPCSATPVRLHLVPDGLHVGALARISSLQRHARARSVVGDRGAAAGGAASDGDAGVGH